MGIHRLTIDNLLPLNPEQQQYLGQSLKELQGVFKNSTIQKLQKYEIYTQQKYDLSVLDALFLLNQHGKSLRELAKSIHIHDQTLARIFKHLRMPYLLHKESVKRYFQNLTSEQKEERRRTALKASKARSPEKLKENMRKIQQSLTLEQRRKYGRMAGLATQASLTPLQIKKRKGQSIKNLQVLTLEQRKENAKKARQNADLKPNRIEGYIITILRELNIYTEHSQTAQSGRIYYADSKENRRWVRLKNGIYTIPDFKVKSQKK